MPRLSIDEKNDESRTEFLVNSQISLNEVSSPQTSTVTIDDKKSMLVSSDIPSKTTVNPTVTKLTTIEIIEASALAQFPEVNDKVLAVNTMLSAIHYKNIDSFRSICDDEVYMMRYFNSGNGKRGKNIGFILKNDELPDDFEIEVDGELPIALNKMFLYSDANEERLIINSDLDFDDVYDAGILTPEIRKKVLIFISENTGLVTRHSSIIIGNKYYLLTDVQASDDGVSSAIINGQCVMFRATDNKLVFFIDIRW